ncbi:MAG: sterol desaturase family protein [Myxococcales bacterium]|nr:sterol desaturase family protein [Myxococcales bacterium]
MDDLAASLLVLLRATLTQIVGYFALVGLVFLVVWVWGARRLAARRIQAVRRVDGRQLRREVLYTLVTFAVGMASAGAAAVLHELGETRLVDALAPGDGVWALAWVVGLVVFNDAWFYLCHRLLHTPWLFRHVHSVHHRSVDVNPFSSYSFHAVESLLLSAWVVPAVILLPIPLPALALVQVIGLLNNVNSHLGYELLPRWWVRVWPFAWTSTATYHNLHHQRSRGNYGLFFRLWDRALGTEIPGYEATFRERRPPPSP